MVQNKLRGGNNRNRGQNEQRILLCENGCGITEYDHKNQYTSQEKELGHGGADARRCYHIYDYLSGKVEEPMLDLYRAVTLSMAGIYGPYSILDRKTYDIPDIRDKEAREVLRGDYRSPFLNANGNLTLSFGRCRKI